MILKLLSFLVLMELVNATSIDSGLSTRPKEVNIGAIFAFGTTIGKVAKIAIQAALDDVNSSPLVLNGTKLSISMQDSILSGFVGIVEGK